MQRRSRRFEATVEDNDELFQWGDRCARPKTSSASIDRRFFSGFTWNGLKYRRGDHVFIESEIPAKPFVARLDELCDVGANSKMGYRRQAKVTWFKRSDEIEKSHNDHPLEENEVIMSSDKSDSPYVDIETISGKCCLEFVPVDIVPEKSNRTDYLFCRYAQQGRSQMKPLLETNSGKATPTKRASRATNPLSDVNSQRKLIDKEIVIDLSKDAKFDLLVSPVKLRKVQGKENVYTPQKRKSPQHVPDTVEKLANGLRELQCRTPTAKANADYVGTPRSSKAARSSNESRPIRKTVRRSMNFAAKESQSEGEISDGDLVSESEASLTESSSSSDSDVSDVEESPQKRGARRTCPASKTPSKKNPPKRSTARMPARRVENVKSSCEFERAMNNLHVSAIPDQLCCREAQFAEIYEFVEGRLSDSSGGCLYISGVPGTGKTATVCEVMSSLNEAQSMGEVPKFQYIEINGMRLTDPHQAYVQILKQLTGKKSTADQAAEILSAHFKSSKSKEMVVLLADELDLLWTRKQQVLYNLFDWPTHQNSKLVVVAIANTMDLPERMVMNKVASRMGLSRMTFQPYSFQELQEIVRNRLSGLEVIDPDAVQFVSRKVAALSGDARRALDVCRRAVELSEKRRSGDRAMLSPSKKAKKYAVTMSHVNTAIQEMFSSTKVIAVQSLSEQEKLLLRSIVAEFQRTGIEEAIFHKVVVQYESLSRLEGMAPLRSTLLSSCLAKMASLRLLMLSDSRHDFQQKIYLNINADDVSFALRKNQSDCD